MVRQFGGLRAVHLHAVRHRRCGIGTSGDSSCALASRCAAFLEHRRAPTESVRRWQRRLNAVQHRIAGGCHLDRPIDDLITEAGLMIGELETEYG